MVNSESAYLVRLFLAFVGLAYLALAGWCVAQMTQTSQAVGFTLRPGAGQSEYLTVYGGLQASLGVLFLLPLVLPAQAINVLWVSIIVHTAIVAFRQTSLLLFGGETTTYVLALLEVAILTGSVALAWWYR
jgi:hypothetical protein